METIINKTMDPKDLKSKEAMKVIQELNDLIIHLRDKGLKVSSWYGSFRLTGKKNSFEYVNRGYNYENIVGSVDDKNFPWFLYWEIVWIVLNNEFKPGQNLLDLGGSSSLFSYYMAWKGLNVITVDLQKELVDNGNHVAEQMGWSLKNYVMDMRKLDFPLKFDHITSICVYEHIPMYDRVTMNRDIKRLLVPGGKFSITFDYRNPSKQAQIDSPDSVYTQFVESSGLRMRGNTELYDNQQCYLLHPFYHESCTLKYKQHCIKRGYFHESELDRTKQENDYTFAALFLENDSQE